MAGLINTQIFGTKEEDLLAQGKILQAQGIGYDPEKRAVATPETVLGQLDTVLAKESPLITRARANAAQAANARGLLNTSMAVEAGEAAAINAALPIASQDAQAYNLAARENQQAGNTALQFGAEAANRASALNVASASDLARIRETGAIERSLQTLKGEQATGLANIEANYKQLVQASDSAARFFDAMVKSIGAVLSNVDTSEAQKAAAVTKLTQMMESGLAVIGSIANLDLRGLLTFKTG